MAIVHRLATFAQDASFDDLDQTAREQLELRLLDGLGCAVGAMEAEPVRRVRAHVDELGGSDLATLFGGGRTAPDRAALYNGFLVRYLDFNDSYLAPGETCHPSDNIAPVLAARTLADLGDNPLDADAGDGLTSRERDVLREVADGFSNEEIGDRLDISKNTVRFHLRNILTKLHAKNRTEAAVRAVREGLIDSRSDDEH